MAYVLYFNQSGNSWSKPRDQASFRLRISFPRSGAGSAWEWHRMSGMVVTVTWRCSDAPALSRPDGWTKAASLDKGHQSGRGDDH